MRLIASDLALRLILALRQRDSSSLAELADAVRSQPSSCQRALEILAADRLVALTGEGRQRRYALEESNSLLSAIEQLAQTIVDPIEALGIEGNASPAVEFVGLTSNQVIAVFAKGSSTVDRSRAIDALTRSAHALKREPRFLDHSDLRGVPSPMTSALRRDLLRGTVVVGDLDRAIPDRSQHRRTAGRALGHVNTALHLPSARTLRSFKRRHGVRQLKVFGSAVRSDFRPDSDVDIAITLNPGQRAERRTLEALETELERRLGHEVDLVVESELRPAVRYMVDRESVVL